MIGTLVSRFFFIFLIGTMTVLFFKITLPQVPSWWKRRNPFIPQQPESLFKLGTRLFALLEDLAIPCEWFLCFREHDKKVFCLGLTSRLKYDSNSYFPRTDDGCPMLVVGYVGVLNKTHTPDFVFLVKLNAWVLWGNI